MLLAVLILGIIEGLTEFLPVSSTGHLVVASSFLHFDQPWREPFLVTIQLGAIAAVIVDRRRDIAALLWSHRCVSALAMLLLAFFPSAVLGLLFKKMISAQLRNPIGVCVAWVIGGVAILIIDRPRAVSPLKTTDIHWPEVSWKQALGIGLCQCVSLWPGMSRSASTILGGLLVGLPRTAATLFSFYLAIPTMMAASAYELYKEQDHLSGALAPIALGMLISFLVAWAVVHWLIQYVQHHTFRLFALYRICAGLLLLLMPIDWAQ